MDSSSLLHTRCYVMLISYCFDSKITEKMQFIHTKSQPTISIIPITSNVPRIIMHIFPGNPGFLISIGERKPIPIKIRSIGKQIIFLRVPSSYNIYTIGKNIEMVVTGTPK